MLENLIKRVLLQVKNDTARESIKTRLNEIFHALYAENDWNFRHRTNWNTIWDEFREIELHWVSVSGLLSPFRSVSKADERFSVQLFGLYAQLIHNCKPPRFIERLKLKVSAVTYLPISRRILKTFQIQSAPWRYGRYHSYLRKHFLLPNTLSNIVASTEGMLSQTESKLLEMRVEEERGFSSTIAREGKA